MLCQPCRELVAELSSILTTTVTGSGCRRDRDHRRRTLQLPDIAALRERLIAERPVYALLEGCSNCSALAGRIDAVAYAGDRAVGGRLMEERR